jgi:hypothetical protein
MTVSSGVEAPVQTDNRPRPEDGPQDVDQQPTPIPGSPTGGVDVDDDGGA